jgi:dethiobiotin synthase
MLVLITGTDTGIGKTVANCEILRKASAAGTNVHGLKPIETGVPDIAKKTTDSSIILQTLKKLGDESATIDQINLYSYRSPVAPLVAARHEKHLIDWNELLRFIRQADAPDRLVTVEGAGGLLVPICQGKSFADLASELKMKVVIVVGSKLGCINHTLLTVHYLKQRQLSLIGYVFNDLGLFETSPAPNTTVSQESNREILRELLAPTEVPEIGFIPYMKSPFNSGSAIIQPFWNAR